MLFQLMLDGPKPPLGWLKINTNAAFRDDTVCIAFVVQNDTSGLVLIASKLIPAASAYDAEIATILWARETAANKAWIQIEWSSDAKSITQTIILAEALESWLSRYNFIQIISFFSCFYWNLSWYHRNLNCLANAIAKFSLLNNAPLFFEEPYTSSLLPSFLKFACTKLMGEMTL